MSEEIKLSPEEFQRYSRHLVLSEVGLEGQKKLKASSVLIIGVGGLGSPLCLYLAAAGVGRIGIVDFDVVDMTNLQRQLLHTTNDIGRSKIASAKESILAINPNVQVDTFETQLTSANALDIIKQYDIVVDGTDNFPTRYLVNDACVLLGKPNVYGSIFKFDGQVSVFDAKKGPCYRCLYPAPPPPGLVPSCAEGGVLGVLPGIIGSLQAMETIKLIIGQGETLTGRLVLFDALKLQFREMKLKKDPDCPVCGKNPTIRELIDYEEFCGLKPQPANQDEETYEITVKEFKSRLDRGDDLFVIDVREESEREISHLNGLLIPLGELSDRLEEIDSSKEIIVYCRTGRRSGKAVEILRHNGFTRVKNLVGGVNEWSKQIDPSMPRY